VESGRDVWIAWKGPAKVNGKAWPMYDGEFVRLPAGTHRVERGAETYQVLDLNATLISAEASERGITIEYESRSRAIVRTVEGIKMLPPGRQRVHLAGAGS
jgi:hypothetical protein